MSFHNARKASLLALMMLFVLPASLQAAGGQWEWVLDALYRDKAAVSGLSKQDWAILEATILIKARHPKQARTVLERAGEDPLIKQLKVYADRERLVEAVRRAGGTRSEVSLPVAGDELKRAVAEAETRLNRFLNRLQPQRMQSEPALASQAHAVAAPTSVQELSQTFLERMLPTERWDYVLEALRKNRMKPARQLTKAQRSLLQAAVLLKRGESAQALQLLDANEGGENGKYLKIRATNERTIQAVLNAGGSLSEVHLPAEPAGMDAAMAAIDAQLGVFMQQLDAVKSGRHAHRSAHAAKPKHQVRRTVRNAVAQSYASGPSVSDAAPKAATAEVVKKAAQPAAETVAAAGKQVERAPVVSAVKGHAAGQAQAASAAGRSASRGGPAAVAADPALRDTVVQAVEAWRASWSNQDLDVYFSAYADDFVVADRFESMQAWKAYKRWVIGKRKSIQVTLELVKVLPQAADLVRVEFLQHFRADDYKSDDLKVLTLHSSPDGWKIVREESI